MIIFPAVDLQGGQAVRLRQGKAEESTVFSPDPVAAALRWQNEGAQWLHLVDLDGAFQGESVNVSQVRAICSTLEIPVQLGGGVRDEAAARMWFDAGVSRLIIGTLALENPEEFSRICKLFPGRIGVSLDADNGRLKTRGWVKDSGLMVDEIVPGLADAGAAFLIYTDIARDGMKSGVNLPMLEKLSRESPVPVIAAGGVNSLADIEALYPLSVEAGLEGAISGRALYDGSLKLPEALDFLRKNRLQADSAGSGSLSFLTGRKRNGIPSGSCMDMCMSTDAFPLEHLVEESEEPLWFWDILSDRLCLSLGVLNKLELSPQEAPADMKAYLRHLPPAEQDAVRHTLEEFLSSGEQLFRLLYFFDCRQVVAYAGVFRRDAGGRPIQIIGCLELAEQTPHIPFVGHAVAFLDKDLVCFDRNCAILLNREQAEPFTRSLGETVDLLHESERWQLRSLRRMYVPGSACDQFEENFMLLQNGGTYTRLNVNISVVQRDDRGRATMLAATLQSAFSSQSAAGSLLTLAVRGTGDGLWDWDATNDSVYYSPRYLSMLGYTTESFPPCLESWMKNIHPDDYEQTVPIQKAVVESPSSGNSFEVTYRMKKADNS